MSKLNLDFYDLEAIEAESERMRMMLVKIETELDLELERIFLEHAEMMKGLAQTYVRVDTGSLWKSIRIERLAKHHIAVRAGGYIVNPKSHKIVDYQTIVEAKYPYMRPAYEQVLPMLEQDIDDLMLRLTESV